MYEFPGAVLWRQGLSISDESQFLRTFTTFNESTIVFVRNDGFRKRMKPQTEESSNIVHVIRLTELVTFAFVSVASEGKAKMLGQ